MFKLIRTHSSVSRVNIQSLPFSAVCEIDSIWLVYVVVCILDVLFFGLRISIKVRLDRIFGITLVWDVWAVLIWLTAAFDNRLRGEAAVIELLDVAGHYVLLLGGLLIS